MLDVVSRIKLIAVLASVSLSMLFLITAVIVAIVTQDLQLAIRSTGLFLLFAAAVYIFLPPRLPRHQKFGYLCLLGAFINLVVLR